MGGWWIFAGAERCGTRGLADRVAGWEEKGKGRERGLSTARKRNGPEMRKTGPGGPFCCALGTHPCAAKWVVSAGRGEASLDVAMGYVFGHAAVAFANREAAARSG